MTYKPFNGHNVAVFEKLNGEGWERCTTKSLLEGDIVRMINPKTRNVYVDEEGYYLFTVDKAFGVNDEVNRVTLDLWPLEDSPVLDI